MKHFLLLCLVIFVGCDNSHKKETGTFNHSASSETDAKAPTSENEEYFNITIDKGRLAGTYILKTISGDYMSQMNIGYDESTNATSISAIALTANAEKFDKISITKWVTGNAEVGTMKPITECLLFQIIDSNNTYDYVKIDGITNDCNSVTIADITGWEVGSIYKSRGIAGSFSDKVILDITSDNGTKTTETILLKVDFGLRQKMLNTK